MSPKIDAMSVIAAACEPLMEKRILDIGCGKGGLARSLAAQGACVTGVDPNSKALAAARRAVPTGTFRQAGAEALPFADRSFEGTIFLNSLHHVPKLALHRALRESARVTKHEAPIVVIEPSAEGSFFSVLRVVEDETNVRAAAQKAVEEAFKSGTLEQLGRTDYLRCEYFTNLDQFLTHVVAAEPARTAIVEHRRPEIEAAFRRYARVSADGRRSLEQPMHAHVLKAKARSGRPAEQPDY